MKGANAVVSMVLMFLVVIGTAVVFFSYVNHLKGEIISTGEKQMVTLSIPPKLLSLVCYTGYGYMKLSLSQGQKTVSGTALYSVDLDTGKRVAEGIVNMELNGSGKVYIPYLFDKDERYLVTLSGKKWSISEYCRPFSDPYLVLYLPFSSSDGQSISDQSDYESTYSATNISYVTGYVGDAASFDGNSSYVWLGTDTNFNPEKFTLAMWVKTSSNQTDMELYRWRLHGMALSMSWDANNIGKIKAKIFDNNTVTYSVNSSAAFDDGSWHFIASTYNQSLLGLYIDGQFVNFNSTSIDIYYNTGVAALGRDGDYSGSFFNGTLDEVRLYSRALSKSELNLLYEAYQKGE